MKSISLFLSTLLVGVVLLSGYSPGAGQAVEPAAKEAEKVIVPLAGKLFGKAEKAVGKVSEGVSKWFDHQASNKEHPIIKKIEDGIGEFEVDCIKSALGDKKASEKTSGACMDRKPGSQN